MLSERTRLTYQRQFNNQAVHPSLIKETPMKGNPIRKRLLRRRLTLFGLIAVITFSWMLYQEFSVKSILAKKKAERDRLEHRLESMKKNGSGLRLEITRLKNPNYIAQIARRDYFLSKKGEILFHLDTKKKTEIPE
ncbi:FtsB family cell division protein [Neobacillus terrae]|uniref:FtsB family cell division protein n=1 Tax=Neobacillus terrae TaxID=3034837 RepID=UPI0014080B65|nr:septum formation initiator family protein [Neobacillus terrae]NHM32000.1 septum formation initiator family protein [Neobacillus terrae]